jgi:hypothetical protein
MEAVLAMEYVTIYYVSEPEEIKGVERELNRWKVIAEHSNSSGQRVLNWFYTYSPKLAELGTKHVEFYKDTQWRECIRVPRRK